MLIKGEVCCQSVVTSLQVREAKSNHNGDKERMTESKRGKGKMGRSTEANQMSPPENKNVVDRQKRPPVFKNLSCKDKIEEQFKKERKQIRWKHLQTLELHTNYNHYCQENKVCAASMAAYTSKSNLSEEHFCIFFPSSIHFTSLH